MSLRDITQIQERQIRELRDLCRRCLDAVPTWSTGVNDKLIADLKAALEKSP